MSLSLPGIREEIADGKSVATAIETGFARARSAILDGNITTLIAAAVLGLRGSGTVKGFASTLAIGIILSMFTCMVVTKVLMHAVYAIGVRVQNSMVRQKSVSHLFCRKDRNLYCNLLCDHRVWLCRSRHAQIK